MREPRARHETPPGPREGGKALRLPLEAGAGHRPDRTWKVAVFLALGAVALACARADPHRRGFSVALATVAILALATAAVGWLLGRGRASSAAPRAWLVIDDHEITRVHAPQRAEGRGRTSLARWDTPFGLSILANSARTRALFAFTTPVATRFLGLRLETPRDADLARDLLDRAVTIADVDLDLAAGPVEGVQLGAAAARTFLGELDRRDPQARQRLYLSDARGAAIVVDPDRLVIGERVFDLASPVEWRVFTFQEGDAGAATLYQATSVRQGTNDAVLVCGAPAELASWGLGRAPDPPPARETRVAIDRLFMTPLRAALERAPRITRPGAPPSRKRGRPAET